MGGRIPLFILPPNKTSNPWSLFSPQSITESIYFLFNILTNLKYCKSSQTRAPPHPLRLSTISCNRVLVWHCYLPATCAAVVLLPGARTPDPHYCRASHGWFLLSFVSLDSSEFFTWAAFKSSLPSCLCIFKNSNAGLYMFFFFLWSFILKINRFWVMPVESILDLDSGIHCKKSSFLAWCHWPILKAILPWLHGNDWEGRCCGGHENGLWSQIPWVEFLALLAIILAQFLHM